MLTVGERFRFDGVQWRVAYVTPSRAHCITTATRLVTVPGKHGQPRTFTATIRRTIDVSPETIPALLQELGL